VLAVEKGRLAEFELYSLVERITPEVFRVFKGEKSTKVVCINIDFYSGFVYSCLEISRELYTPLFAIARVSGWCTHRIEELTFSAKRLIRPAFKNVYGKKEYVPMIDR
jgi:citrate synthase